VLTGPEAALREHYGFETLVVGERLEGGYANDVFRAVADGEEVVVRVKHPPVIAADVAWEHRLIRLLGDRLAEVHAPVAGLDGSTFVASGETILWVTPFLEGAPADPARAEHRLEAARALGRVHRAGTELDLARRPRLRPLSLLDWPPLPAVPELADAAAEIADARAWAIAYVERLASERRPAQSLVHGDFFPGNVLLAGDRVAAVLDWEEAQRDWLTWDLATGMWTFCEDDDDLDREACERFVVAYREAGGTAPVEDDDLLVPLVRVKRILEVLRAPTDRHPRWDYQRRNLRAFANLR